MNSFDLLVQRIYNRISTNEFLEPQDHRSGKTKVLLTQKIPVDRMHVAKEREEMKSTIYDGTAEPCSKHWENQGS